MSAGLGREDIRALLDDLSAELAARGARAEIFLVGGAALAVAYDATSATCHRLPGTTGVDRDWRCC